MCSFTDRVFDTTTSDICCICHILQLALYIKELIMCVLFAP